MQSIVFNDTPYQLPESVDDVIELVKQAATQGKQLRIRGAGHSIPQTFASETATCIHAMLAKMNGVYIDIEKMQVTVEAGCHLGVDPFDPTGISTLQNSLCYQLWQRGLALPDLGGITHQAVGGFLSTGSSGGSLKYAFDEMLLRVQIVNGKGELVTFSKSDDLTDPFYAAGVSMGLLGVIVSATFQCVPTFDIIGSETITTVDNCAIDLFGDSDDADKIALKDFLYRTDYARLFWWPQENVNKMVVWQARHMHHADYARLNQSRQTFTPKPYQEVPSLPLVGEKPAQIAGSLIFSAIGQWPTWLSDVIGSGPGYTMAKEAVEAAFSPIILPKLLDLFVSVNEPPQNFWDYWWSGIPMDNQMSDKLFPILFTELWIPVEKTTEVMKALRDFYAQGPSATGTFNCEIYSAKKSDFWMSPSHGTDVIRVDVLWWGNSPEGPSDFYMQFWKLLAPFGFRCHWGKFMPPADGALNNPNLPYANWREYVKAQYPQWDAFLSLREEMDPQGVFATDYWKSYFNIGIEVQNLVAKNHAYGNR